MELDNQQKTEILNGKVQIYNINIFPSEEKDYNKCILYFSKNKIDYILYAEKVEKNVKIISEKLYGYLSSERYTLETEMLPIDNTIFSIIRLTPIKKVTMKDIEKKFGEPIEIIDYNKSKK